jgi:signal transduction histidine kinase
LPLIRVMYIQRFYKTASPTVWLILLCFLCSFLASSCKHKYATDNNEVKQQLKAIDSLKITGNTDSAHRLLTKLRPQITLHDAYICDYYYFQAQRYSNNADSLNLYADSALSFFSNDELKKEYPNQYFKALVIKGDAYSEAKQYNSALKYYYDAKNETNTGNCDDGNISVKIAGLYYNQRNYAMAATCWIESVDVLANCQEKLNRQKLFYLKQGALNNAGIAYEKAGEMDSARYYYLQDVDLINKTAQKDTGSYINAARIVVYDNLGGLNLKEGKLSAALKYLTQCMAIPLQETDGIKIPPLLKLTDLYLKTADYKSASATLSKSRIKLNRYGKANHDLELIWMKHYAQYLFKQGQPVQAFNYQKRYLNMRDSLEGASSNIFRLDVTRELNALYQQQVYDDLKHRNKIKKLYLAGSIVIVIMAFVIILLISHNLKRSQKANKDTLLHNQRLQHTLDELERVNQNYIRIMRVMAHDLRNPLSGMTGLATMMLDDEAFTDDHKHMLKLIETTGAHSMEMINELLKSGLADENEQIDVQMVDLKALLFDSVELLQFKANEKHQRILFESEEKAVWANVNHEKIWRVFNNLIVNAIKFSQLNGIIQVGITHDDEHILISVADNGIGIAAGDKDRVFEMFTTAKKAGTNGEQPFGLGLSISKRIVEKHNGRIWFESNPNVGTTFYIQLPYALKARPL